MNSFAYVKQVVRSIMGDPYGDWLDDAYLTPMVNHVYRLQIGYLANTCSTNIMKVVEVLNVPVGTTDLSQYQLNKGQQKGQLFGLRDVFEVDWKQAGFPPTSYREGFERAKLPDVAPGAPNFRLWYEWRAFILYVTPLSFAADLRVRGDFTPPPLVNEDDPVMLHPDLGDVLAEEVGACAQRERGNAGQMQTYQLVGTEALDDIAAQLVRGGQAVPVRLGRITRRHGR